MYKLSTNWCIRFYTFNTFLKGFKLNSILEERNVQVKNSLLAFKRTLLKGCCLEPSRRGAHTDTKQTKLILKSCKPPAKYFPSSLVQLLFSPIFLPKRKELKILPQVLFKNAEDCVGPTREGACGLRVPSARRDLQGKNKYASVLPPGEVGNRACLANSTRHVNTGGGK